MQLPASSTSSEAHRRVILRPDGPPGHATMADRLYAAKPVTWRGQGDLPQFPWAKPFKGTWLVVDLWSGIGGLLVALLAMGVHFYAVAAEMDDDAAHCTQAVMPHVVPVSRVEDLRAVDFIPMLVRRAFRGVLLGGGSPCQGNSALNRRRRGLDDTRSQQPLELQRLVSEFEQLPACQGMEIVAFLENVASMPKQVQQAYETWLAGPPILLDGGSCGWVSRRRFFWLRSRRGVVSPANPPPESWQWCTTTSGVAELRYAGKKPLPPQVFWDDHFLPLLSPQVVLQQAGKGAMHTFTREFYHPEDRVPEVSPAAAERFYADQRRFPPGAYEEHSLLWHGKQWRQPSPAERCQMMCLPPALVAPARGNQVKRTQAQNSFIGNGFHIPCVVALMAMLPSILEAKFVPSFTSAEEAALRDRLRHTVWEPGRLEAMPGLLTAAEVCLDLRIQFAFADIPDRTWHQVLVRLQACDLASLQAYPMWRRFRQEPWEVLGPVPIWGRMRTAIFAGLTGQRYPSSSAKGLDHLLPPGLGKDEHVKQARHLPSPFHPSDWPEPDVSFVVQALGVWQQFLPVYSQRLRRTLKAVEKAVQILNPCLAAVRSTSSNKVAHAKQPAFVATMACLLRWPDRDMARQLVQGFAIVGSLPPSGVFRGIQQADKLPLADWLGPSAEAEVQRLIRSRPPLHAPEILAVTQDEILKGFCSPLRTMQEMNDQFGVGGWRAVERFLIIQPDGKQRVIDNARKSGHNRHTSMQETISTVNVDFVASVARMVNTALETHWSDPPDWLDLRLGTDDLPDAYRGLPVQDDHLRFSNVAIFVPDEGWRFTTMYGLAYGLESAVVSFNRSPQLCIAIARRCTLSFCAAYFDDELAVDFVHHADVSQRGLQLVFQLMGAPPQASKSFAPGRNRHYLGTSVHVGDFVSMGAIRFQPKFTTQRKVLAKIHLALATNSLSPDDAGKLRGDLNWMFSMCAGQAGRIAGPTLTALQHADSPTLSPEDAVTFQLLAALVTCPGPRDVAVRALPPQPVLVYSDASFEHGVLRVGWVVFGQSSRPQGLTCVVPQEVIESWTDRTQQIYPGETLCGLLVPWFHGATLHHQDLLWFIDNEAAVASLIRGSSSQIDVHTLVQVAHFLFQRFQIRVWIEWIDSESNPSDGLSRDGVSDSWTRSQPWDVSEVSYPDPLRSVCHPAHLSRFLEYMDSG